ncbi:hypothetical protein [Puerhibacterium puerhi]|uniref:hypothetical protein n=1 Tax=Puerhibacterium puerhi TaxID=2692623 RepID=UPI0013594EF0|nr:hypothetical protein [Puerhibacterium puerhi]
MYTRGDDGAERPTERRASAAALEAAAVIKNRVGRRTTAPVRAVFLEQRDTVVRSANEPAPMAKLLRGGRGGDVRLKLELSFLWFAAAPPHDLAYPARAWATLLDLRDPNISGTRRIRQAINALAEAKLVSVTTQPGQPSRITLLNEGGQGEKYTLPGRAFNTSRSLGFENPHRYIQIPDTFWTSGWLAALSGAGIAMFLILLTELGPRDPEKTDLWFSPERAEALYGLSEDTRSKGLRELRAAGIATARRQSASRNAFDFRRLRNTYRLDLSRLEDPAVVPVNPVPDPPTAPSAAAVEDLFAAHGFKPKKFPR